VFDHDTFVWRYFVLSCVFASLLATFTLVQLPHRCPKSDGGRGCEKAAVERNNVSSMCVCVSVKPASM